MAGDKNIEELFRTSFEQFQPEVDPGVWTGLEGKLDQLASAGATATGGVATGVAASSGVLKSVFLAAGIGIAAVATGIVLYNVSSTEKDEPVEAPSEIIADYNALQIDPKDRDVDNVNSSIEDDSRNDTVLEQSAPVNERPSKGNENTNVVLPPMSWADTWLTSPGKTYYHESTSSTSKADSSKTQKTIDVSAPSVPSTKIGTPSNSEVKFEVQPLQKDYYQGRAYSFIANGTFSKIEWRFGDGRQLSGGKVSHTLTQIGEIPLLVTALNEAGDKVEQRYVVTVVEGPGVVVPNVFTPNEDGVNDYFMVEHRKLKSFTMLVVTLGGEEVITITNPDEGWNGEIRGQPAPEGQYLVSVQAIGEDDVALPLVKKIITLSRSRR